MIYTKEVENMCPVAKGAKHEPLLFLKKESGYTQRRLKISLVLHMVLAGAHHSRVLVNFH